MPISFVTGYPELLAPLHDELGRVARVFAKPVEYPELTAAMRGSLSLSAQLSTTNGETRS